MRKTIIGLFLVCAIVFCAACNATSDGTDNKTNDFIPDVAIDQIDWSVGAGIVNGGNYVLSKITNNSKFKITSLKISFTEKQGISKKDKDAFYADIQKSQGFDDEWMKKYIESREKLSQPASMYFRIDDGIAIGETKNQIKCYYLDGWTSKNVVYHNLFVPEIATIEYEKEGAKHTIVYNFESETYEIGETK